MLPNSAADWRRRKVQTKLAGEKRSQKVTATYADVRRPLRLVCRTQGPVVHQRAHRTLDPSWPAPQSPKCPEHPECCVREPGGFPRASSGSGSGGSSSSYCSLVLPDARIASDLSWPAPQPPKCPQHPECRVRGPGGFPRAGGGSGNGSGGGGNSNGSSCSGREIRPRGNRAFELPKSPRQPPQRLLHFECRAC